MMDEVGPDRQMGSLKGFVLEASRSLARLDAARLEELALSCQTLNRIAAKNKSGLIQLRTDAHESKQEMEVLARVLDVTRDNMRVFNRLRELRAGRFEYDLLGGSAWKDAGRADGDD